MCIIDKEDYLNLLLDLKGGIVRFDNYWSVLLIVYWVIKDLNDSLFNI